ncbi:MAG: lasso peptide biosynthesis B2 protein [Bacteroidales bacterium]|nr:lasso peptide biosynthesis B2 protein [Bacteroidales bacterium]
MKNVKFPKLSSTERRLFIEAACETLLVRIVTTFRNTRKYASWFGQSQVETEPVVFDARRKEQVLQIKTAIARCRHLVWGRKCLVESIAAKRMLNRRQIPATLYMGVAKNEKGKLIAHAWIRSGDIWVSGGRNRHKFTVVGIFS